jgi:nitroreductase
MKTILNRRSIRAYKQEQIRDEELNTILEAGVFAPSAINEQPWQITAVQNAELLHRINEACRTIVLKTGNKIFAERAKSPEFSIFYNAPTLIIVLGYEKAIAPQVDCALALENMFLAAESLGIGSCWINAVIQLSSDEEGSAIIKGLGIPEGYKIYCAGSFGYKAAGSPEAAPRKENMVNIVR